MRKAIYSVLVLLPLALILSGVAGLLSDRLTDAAIGRVPVSIVLILVLLAWSVMVAWAYLLYEDRGEDR